MGAWKVNINLPRKRQWGVFNMRQGLRHRRESIACHSRPYIQPAISTQLVHSQKDASIMFLGQAIWLS